MFHGTQRNTAPDRKSTRLNSSHGYISYAVFCLKKKMLPTGKVEVVTGSSAHGQRHETAWSQIVADQLGVPFEDIRVLHGDTQVPPKRMDTYGSRSLTVGGMALVGACDKVIAKAKRITAHMLEASEDDIEVVSGRRQGR